METEQKPGATGDERPAPEGSAGPILIAFVVVAVVIVLLGWLSQP